MSTDVKPKKHFREVSKDFAVYGLLSALSQMSGVLLLPLFTRIFSVDEYGMLDVIAIFVSLISTVMGLALTSALIRYFTEKTGPNERAGFVSTLFIATLGFGFLILIVISLLSPVIASGLLGDQQYSNFIQLGGWIALFTALASVPKNVLRMERRIVAYNLLGLLETIVYLGLALYFVLVLRTGILGVFTAQLIGAILLLVTAIVFTYRYLTLTLSIAQLKQALSYSLPLLPNLVSTWINSQTDRILLLLLIGLGGVAVFGAAARITKVVVFLLVVFQMGWAPYSMLIIQDPSRNAVYRRMLNYYTGLFAVLALALTAISPELFRFLLPDEYHSAYVIIPWLVGAAIVHKSATLTKLGVLVSEKTAAISLASLVAVILNIIIAYFLIGAFGVTGAAIGSFMTQLLFTGSLWWFSLKQSDVRFDGRAVLVVLITYVVTSILLLAVAGGLVGFLSGLLRVLLLVVAVTVIAYYVVDGPVWQLVSKIVRKDYFGLERS